MQAFEELVTNGERAKISTILCKFTLFLVCLAQKSHCFPHWQHFKGIFPRLLAAAGDQLPQSIADEANLLESLANTPALPHEPVNVSGVPVLLRTKFYNCNLYRSFMRHRVVLSLVGAQAATTNEARLEFLEPCRDLQGLPDDLAQAVLCALQVFDDSVPLADRVDYIRTGGAKDNLAINWDPSGAVGVVAKLFQEAPDLSMVDYTTLAIAAKAVMKSDHVEDNVNPLLKQAILLIHEFEEAAVPDDIKNPILAQSLHLRLGILAPGDMGAIQSSLIETIPKDALTKLFPRLSVFLKGHSSPPLQWLSELKAAFDKEKEAKAEAKKAKAEAEAKKAKAAAATGAPPAATGATPAAVGEAEAAGGGVAASGAAAEGDAEGDATGDAQAAAQQQQTPQARFSKDDVVIVTFGMGNNEYNQKRAIVDNVLSQHCWVVFDEGAAKGTRKKILQSHLEPTKAATGAAAAAGAVATGAVAATGAAAATDGQPLARELAWQKASELFNE